ncbi:hypothetical protein QR680_003803 [Steinernema hermaphroditum]|uniref:Uncharacterized protein n=1 Tax=Steinernema hermaphroditum TaxID=289476 RepID=A0AA39LSP6_9BILA|nr:hypothetical protein QR680_003803 [Steinernema hermaphroditum]
MDTVPFTFCDAVVATLTKLPKPQYLWGAVPQTQGSIWDAAVQSHKEMRLSLTLCIGYDNGMFSYISGMKVQYLSFAELRNLPEKYTRITAVIITDMKSFRLGLVLAKKDIDHCPCDCHCDTDKGTN